MNRKHIVKTALTTLGLTLITALPAHSAVFVVGSGFARDCYVAVKNHEPHLKSIETCDLALTQERLKRRDRAATFVNRGILRMRQQQYERALADYQRAIDLHPELVDAHVNRGAALYGLKRYDEAMVEFNKGIKSERLDVKVATLYNRGLTHEKLGDLTSAYYDFREASKLDPNFELATKQLSRFEVRPAD